MNWIRCFTDLKEQRRLHCETACQKDTKEGDGDGLYILGPGSGTMKRCGLVGISVSLWVLALRTSS